MLVGRGQCEERRGVTGVDWGQQGKKDRDGEGVRTVS